MNTTNTTYKAGPNIHTATALDHGVYVDSTATISQHVVADGGSNIYDMANIRYAVLANANVHGSCIVSDGVAVISSSLEGSVNVVGGAIVQNANLAGAHNLSGTFYVSSSAGVVSMSGVGSENRTATAAWCYVDRVIKVRAGCFFGTLEDLEARILRPGTWAGWGDSRDRWRTQYQCLIAAASFIPQPDTWPVHDEVFAPLIQRGWRTPQP